MKFLPEDDPQRIETCRKHNVLNTQLYTDKLCI